MATITIGALSTIQIMLLELAIYLKDTITASNVDTQQDTLEAIRETLWNALNILDAYLFSNLMGKELLLLTRITASSLGLSSSDLLYIVNRIESLSVFVNTVYPLPLNLQFDLGQLVLGKPALPSYDLESYLNNFNAETPPVGLTVQNIQQFAQNCSNAWNGALLYLQSNGTSFQLSGFNQADRMQQSSNDIAVKLLNLTVDGVSLDPTQMWNLLVALPSILLDSTILLNDPSKQFQQTAGAIRYLIILLSQQVNALLSSFIIPNVAQPQLSTLHAEENLMDFANRTTGDYTQWSTIATLNGLIPPYTGTVPAPGIAVPGQNLYLPTVPPIQGTLLSDYLSMFLGTDIDFGSIGSTMTVWNGDFTTISGFNNLTASLARRVLTPLGNLIYHRTYGSRLPEMVGAVSTSSSAMLLASYLKSSVLSDPRIQSVASISAQPYNGDQIVLRTAVIPKGTSQAANVNLVLIPQTPLGVPKS